MKENNDDHTCQVFHFDLYGTREQKYDYLRQHDLTTVEWQQLTPQAPSFFFVPKDFSLQEEYDKGFRIDELMKVNACGIVTARDAMLVSYSPAILEQVRKDFATLSEDAFREKYSIKDSQEWTYQGAKEDAKNAQIVPISYRPFDNQYVLYSPKSKGITSRPRYDIMRHFLYGYYRDTEGIEKGTHSSSSAVQEEGNIGLVICKQQSTFDFQHIFVSEQITDKCTISAQTKEAGYVFPLYLYPESGSLDTSRRMNKDEAIVERIGEAIRDADGSSAKNGTQTALSAEGKVVAEIADEPSASQAIFDYIYGVLHSPTYRERYKEFLKVDFPRIPYPKVAAEFEHYRHYGNQLRELHFLFSAKRHPNQGFCG